MLGEQVGDVGIKVVGVATPGGRDRPLEPVRSQDGLNYDTA